MEELNPLTAPLPADVPLAADAPLVPVIAQVRFPPIISLDTSRDDFLTRLWLVLDTFAEHVEPAIGANASTGNELCLAIFPPPRKALPIQGHFSWIQQDAARRTQHPDIEWPSTPISNSPLILKG